MIQVIFVLIYEKKIVDKVDVFVLSIYFFYAITRIKIFILLFIQNERLKPFIFHVLFLN